MCLPLQRYSNSCANLHSDAQGPGRRGGSRAGRISEPGLAHGGHSSHFTLSTLRQQLPTLPAASPFGWPSPCYCTSQPKPCREEGLRFVLAFTFPSSGHRRLCAGGAPSRLGAAPGRPLVTRRGAGPPGAPEAAAAAPQDVPASSCRATGTGREATTEAATGSGGAGRALHPQGLTCPCPARPRSALTALSGNAP